MWGISDYGAAPAIASRRAAMHAGVDMETSATFCAGRRFGRRAVGLLNLSDHLLRGDHLMNYTDERERVEGEVDARIRKLALYLATLRID